MCLCTSFWGEKNTFLPPAHNPIPQLRAASSLLSPVVCQDLCRTTAVHSSYPGNYYGRLFHKDESLKIQLYSYIQKKEINFCTLLWVKALNYEISQHKQNLLGCWQFYLLNILFWHKEVTRHSNNEPSYGIILDLKGCAFIYQLLGHILLVFPLIGSWAVIFPLLYNHSHLTPFHSRPVFSLDRICSWKIEVTDEFPVGLKFRRRTYACSIQPATSCDIVDRKGGCGLRRCHFSGVSSAPFIRHLFLCRWQSWNFTHREDSRCWSPPALCCEMTYCISLPPLHFSVSVMLPKLVSRVLLPRVSLRACACFIKMNPAFNKSPEQ